MTTTTYSYCTPIFCEFLHFMRPQMFLNSSCLIQTKRTPNGALSNMRYEFRRAITRTTTSPLRDSFSRRTRCVKPCRLRNDWLTLCSVHPPTSLKPPLKGKGKVNGDKRDVFWYPTQSTCPPKNYTPGAQIHLVQTNESWSLGPPRTHSCA
jgi:hypothetical protein